MHAIQLSRPLRFLLLFPFFALLIAGITVPSDGGHGILSIKSLAFLSTVATVSLLLFARNRLNLIQIKILSFLVISFTFLLAWMLISFIYDETPPSSAWDQFKIFWITISVIALSVYVVSAKLISFSTFLKTILYANCAYSTLKFALVLLHVVGVIDLMTMMQTFGLRFMSMGILNTLPRMQTSIDIATPFLIFFFLQRKRFGVSFSRSFSIYFILISTISIFLSFSRFLIFVGLLSVLLHAMTLGIGRIVRYLPFVFIVCLLGVSMIGFDNVAKIIEKRLFSKENIYSDRDRVEQVEDLMDEHNKYPWLGKGLGGYVDKNIRDKDVRHSYEVQWVAFLMQFGIVGLLFILAGVAAISIKVLSRPLSIEKVALYILFLAWLFSGFTNPFLVSLTSGILYSLFLIGGTELSYRKTSEA